jgi:hypothetical protein
MRNNGYNTGTIQKKNYESYVKVDVGRKTKG